MTPGVYSLADLMAQRFSTANSIGLDTINTILQAQLAYDNAAIDNMISDFASPTELQLAIWGTHTTGEMTMVDEYGHAMAEKKRPGITAGFPLHKFAYELGWTDDYFKRATGAEVAKMYLEARDAYLNSIRNEILRALARHTVIAFTDEFTDNTTYAVFRLWNGDTVVPPPSPAGKIFAAAHEHYIDHANYDEVRVQAVISTVEEHGNTRGVKLYIAAADLATVAALISFVPLTSAVVIAGQGDTRLTAQVSDLEDRQVGYWVGNGEEIWVKPYMVTKYFMCVATGMDEKALLYRTPAFSGLKGLRIEAPLPDYPLYAQEMTSQFGFGVWNRGMAAFGYHDGGGWDDMV